MVAAKVGDAVGGESLGWDVTDVPRPPAAVATRSTASLVRASLSWFP